MSRAFSVPPDAGIGSGAAPVDRRAPLTPAPRSPAENSFRRSTRAQRSVAGSQSKAGIADPAPVPSVMDRKRSASVGGEPSGVDLNRYRPDRKSRGGRTRRSAASPLPSPASP